MSVARLALAAGMLMICSVAGAAQYAIIVAGLGGEEQYDQRFREQAETIAQAARKSSEDAANVVVLTGNDARRDALRREMLALGKRMEESDAVTIVLIGHGSFDGDEYRFNVPGPDLTGTELGRMFDQLPARQQLIVNASSASGAVFEQWRRPQRVIVAATKSGGERTATRFAQHWAQAVSTDAADINKDDIVTAAEAFEYANREVAAAFKADVALATEHARMEGEQTERFAVARLGTAGIVSSDPEVNALLTQRGTIERDLNAVKQRKPSLSEAEYYDALEGVLVKLALLQREIDAKQAVPQ
ncbi:MAG: hypothetical protein ACREUC_17210 [Steroidobacteraceae bacterium]